MLLKIYPLDELVSKIVFIMIFSTKIGKYNIMLSKNYQATDVLYSMLSITCTYLTYIKRLARNTFVF